MSATLSDDLSYATAADLVVDLAARQISSVELTNAAIARIERLDGPINAVVVRDFDRALADAKAADAAIARGERRPLLGVPMTVKEAHNVAGLPTTWGSEAFGGWTAEADSIGVARLKAAGAVVLGKTNVPPFLADWQSANPIYGRTANPWDLGRSPGGSSGGSAAALAAGMVPLEFGSDIGGSIRIPSVFCGVYGHKPSFDLIPQRGHAPPGLDGDGVPLGVIGPMARSAADLELALSVLAGPAGDEAKGYRLDLPAPRHGRLADYRVLVIDQHPLAGLDEAVAGPLRDLARRLDDLGAEVAFGGELLPDLAQAHGMYLGLLNTVMSRGAPPGPETVSAHAYMDMLDGQVMVRRQWAALFERFDVVLAPAFGTVAFPHDANPDPRGRTLSINGTATPYFGQLAWPGLATFANLPATAAPIGQTAEGLPVGVQIIGGFLEDRTTIAFAGLLEREFGGFRKPPGY
jgi:amidase